MTRFWQQFRSARGMAAGLSEVLALFLGVVELRTFFSGSLASGTMTWIAQATTGFVAFILLGGAMTAMRRGNLAWLLMAWAFVLGVEFQSTLRLGNELQGQPNGVFAILAANFEIPVAVLGFLIALCV